MTDDPTLTDGMLVNEDGTKVDPDAFTAWVADHPANVLGLELSHALAECIGATQIHHKKSSFQLQVTIEQGDSYFGELIVTPVVSSKPAKADPMGRPFFPNTTGGLSRRNPAQPMIPGTEDT